MLNGYGRYGQVWNIPSELLEAGDLSGYSSGCTGCGTTGLGGRGTRGRRRRQKKRKSRAAAKRWRARGQGLPDCIRKLRNCRSRCPNAAGFGEDWEDVDETIKELYLDGLDGLGMGLGNLPKWALPAAAVAAFLWWKSK